MELSHEDVATLARLAGLPLREPELSDVRVRLMAMFEAIEEVALAFGDALDDVDPVPLLLPREIER